MPQRLPSRPSLDQLRFRHGSGEAVALDRLETLHAAGRLQARLCRENGSPTYEAIIDALVARLRHHDAAVELLRTDARDAIGSAVYLRLLGAVHRLVLADPSCRLRSFYPTAGGTAAPDRVVPIFLDVVEANAETVAAEMRREVQTNEVGRSAPLSAAMNFIAARSGARLRLLEVGASAGLNLWLDRYRVHAPARRAGVPTTHPCSSAGISHRGHRRTRTSLS